MATLAPTLVLSTLLLLLTCLQLIPHQATGLSMQIYNIPDSGWTSPKWRWGSAIGTGHDCAMICRERFGTRSSRAALVESLLSIHSGATAKTKAVEEHYPFEEVKLVLGLAWQNGRWTGADGGKGGYGEVLSRMAAAVDYEGGNDPAMCAECDRCFVEDLRSRFHLVAASEDDVRDMNDVAAGLEKNDVDTETVKRVCAGMVLRAMGFVDSGL